MFFAERGHFKQDRTGARGREPAQRPVRSAPDRESERAAIPARASTKNHPAQGCFLPKGVILSGIERARETVFSPHFR